MRIGSGAVGAVVLAAVLGVLAHADSGPSDRLIAASRLQETGNHREAIALLEEIREIDPRNPQVIYGLALSLYSVVTTARPRTWARRCSPSRRTLPPIST